MNHGYQITTEGIMVGKVEWLSDEEHEALDEWLWTSGYYAITDIRRLPDM
jgi:hypothetical protein